MKILFVTPRLPYPPDSGAKIRTFNLLKQARNAGNQVVLLSFIYTEDEKAGIEAIEDMGIDVVTVKGKDSIDLFTMIKAFFYGLPLSVAKYCNRKMVSALKELVNNHSIGLVHFDHLHLGQYCDFCGSVPSVIDEHNVESVILMRYAKKETNLFKKLILKNEYKKMAMFEKHQCSKASKVFVVSDNDRYTLVKLCNNGINPEIIPNGVDCDYFTITSTRCDSPKRKKDFSLDGVLNQRKDDPNITQYPILNTQYESSLVFTGSLDWFPNEDALIYFFSQIYPLIKRKNSQVSILVVGKNPSKRLLNFAKSDSSINFTGRVDDVRPYLSKAKVFIVPLRIGGGSRLKILEAMAVGIPVVSTSIGAEGLGVKDNEHLLVADSNYDFADKVLHILENESLGSQLGKKGSEFVRENYDWNNIGKKLINVYREVVKNDR